MKKRLTQFIIGFVIAWMIVLAPQSHPNQQAIKAGKYANDSLEDVMIDFIMFRYEI